MKSLNILQKISHIGEIACRILMIVCAISVIGAIAALFSMLFSSDLGGAVAYDAANKGAGYADLISSLLTAIAYGVIFYFARRYFADEQKAGTPFTEAGAKEIRLLGILTIALPLAALGASAAVYALFKVKADNVDNTAAVTLGVVMLVLSVIFSYGSELIAQRSEIVVEDDAAAIAEQDDGE